AARGLCARTSAFRQKAIVIGAGDIGQLVARKLMMHPEYGIDVAGLVDAEPRDRRQELAQVDVLGPIDDLNRIVGDLDVDRVIVAFSGIRDAETVGVIRAVNELDRDLCIDIVPRLYELVGPKAFLHSVEGLPLIGLPPVRLPRSSRAVKRVVDVVGAVACLVLVLPLLVLVALLIKLDSPGPAFFRQERIGRDLEPFQLLKFRTMTVGTSDAEHRAYIERSMSADPALAGNGLFKLERATSVTRVGRALRRSSLDELPQLINVLRGEMSLVGPRPCLEYETAGFAPHHFERFLVPPGITGLWQV